MNQFRHRSKCHYADGRRNLGGENIESVRCCWPDWTGPIVTDDDSDPAGWAQCGLFATELESGQSVYHYCAPIRITGVCESGVIGEIRYSPDSHCSKENGKAVKLSWDNVWAPCDMLWKIRNDEEVAEAIDAGVKCECGGVPAQRYGANFECRECRTARMAALSAPAKPEKKARKPAAKTAKKAPEKPAKEIIADGRGSEGSPERIAHAALPFPANMYFGSGETRVPQPDDLKPCACGARAFLRLDPANIGKFYVTCSHAQNPQVGKCDYWPMTKLRHEAAEAVADWQSGQVEYCGEVPPSTPKQS